MSLWTVPSWAINVTASGDVNSLQEFLETSVFAIGDLVLLVGIVTVLFILNVELALLTLSIVPLFIVRFLRHLPKAKICVYKGTEANSLANGALAEAIHGIKTVKEWFGKGQLCLIQQRAKQNLLAHLERVAQVNVPIVDTLTGNGDHYRCWRTTSSQFKHGLGVMVAFIFCKGSLIRSLTLQYSFICGQWSQDNVY